MDENKNKIKNFEDQIKEISEEQAEDITGGFVGRDWNKEDAIIYKKLGITHNRHALNKDTYYIGDTKIPRECAYFLADTYVHGTDDERSELMNQISWIKEGKINKEDLERLYKIFD